MQKVGWFVLSVFGFFIFIIFNVITTGFPSAPIVKNLPAAYDLRDMDYPFGVFDQQSCELSYASASTEMFQAALWQQSGSENYFSINQAKECTWKELNQTNDPCGDGDIAQVINLFSTVGTVEESCNPLILGEGTCVVDCLPLFTLTGWQRLSTYQTASVEKIKQALLDVGPVITRINTTMGGYADYDGESVLYDADVFTTTNHTVLIVGWDDTLTHPGGSGAWLIKDSQGETWGDGGFAWVAYGSGGIGKNSSVISHWQTYDQNGLLYYYDQSWELSPMAINANDKTAYMMVLYTTQRAEIVQDIALWTNDAAFVSVWIYDRFENGELLDELYSVENVWLPSAGYHTIPVEGVIELDLADQIALVAYVQNQTSFFPLAVDVESPFAAGKNFYSDDGQIWTVFLESMFHGNFGLRMRTTLPQPPETPHGFEIESLSQTSLKLTWQENMDDYRGYILERYNSLTGQWQRIADLNEGTMVFTDDNLLDDRDYLYRLFAYNLGGLSQPIEATGHTLPYPPPTPTDFLADPVLPIQVNLSWLDSSTNETEFHLDRQVEGGVWERMATLPPNTQTWQDKSVLQNHTYRYRLSAENEGGVSSYVLSDWISIPSFPFSVFIPLVLH